MGLSKVARKISKKLEIGPSKTIDSLPVVPHAKEFNARVLLPYRNDETMKQLREILKLIYGDIAEFPKITASRLSFEQRLPTGNGLRRALHKAVKILLSSSIEAP